MTREEKIKELRNKILTPEQVAANMIERWRVKNKKLEVTAEIPEVPCFNEDVLGLEKAKEYMEFIQNKLIELGAIPKDKLIVGHTYLGKCRNADEAVWKENFRFEYMRTKFGCTYPEEINHFQDDNGYDVFVPIKDVTDFKKIK